MANNGIPGTIANGRVSSFGGSGGSQSQVAALSLAPNASSGTSNVGIPELPSPRPPYSPKFPAPAPIRPGIPEVPPTLGPRLTVDPNAPQYPIVPPLHEGFNVGYPSLFGSNQTNRAAPVATPPRSAQNSIPEVPSAPGRQIPGTPGQIVMPQPGDVRVPTPDVNFPPPGRLNPPGDNDYPNEQLTPAQQALLNLQQKYSQPYTMQ